MKIRKTELLMTVLRNCPGVRIALERPLYILSPLDFGASKKFPWWGGGATAPGHHATGQSSSSCPSNQVNVHSIRPTTSMMMTLTIHKKNILL